MWFERVIWFTVLVAFVATHGVSGKRLTSSPTEPPAARAILSFAGVIMGFTITYVPWVLTLRRPVPWMDLGLAFFLYEGHRESD
jgi:hypothetical protein